MRPQKPVKEFVFKRREPRIPSVLSADDDSSTLFDSEEISISGASIQNIRIEDRSARSLQIEESVLDQVVFVNCNFGEIVLKDVRVLGCNLSNFQAPGIEMVRVEIINSRMMGFSANEATIEDLLISEGDQTYSQFRFSTFKSSEFDHGNFEDGDFYGTSLSGNVFRNKCNLRNAEWRKVKLMDTDIRGSVIDGQKLTADDVRGAIVDTSQALMLASLLGIRIQ
jgi:uncharacterized protein YjbI with pentapeptide repeats